MTKKRFLYSDMQGVKLILRDALDGKRGIRTADKDRVFAIMGYEGTGKSHFLLNCFEYWLKLLKLDVNPEYIKYIGDNKKTFIEGLRDAPRYMMVGHDEAGKDLYARSAMSTFNKDLNIAYQVIRGKNLATFLVLPNILDLDTFFRKRRVTELFVIYKTGKVAYFTKKRLRVLLPKMQEAAKYNDDPDPMNMGIKPLFIDSFPKYEGILLEPYLNRKRDNMDGVIDELVDKYVTNDENKKQKTLPELILPKLQKLTRENPKISEKKLVETLKVSKGTLSKARYLMVEESL